MKIINSYNNARNGYASESQPEKPTQDGTFVKPHVHTHISI